MRSNCPTQEAPEDIATAIYKLYSNQDGLQELKELAGKYFFLNIARLTTTRGISKLYDKIISPSKNS